jgi:hypothetical protein
LSQSKEGRKKNGKLKERKGRVKNEFKEERLKWMRNSRKGKRRMIRKEISERNSS